MESYSVLRALYMSFYSRQLYRDVANNWGGKSLIYLLLILSLSWIVFTIQIQQSISSGYDRISDDIVAEIPVMTIHDGKLSTPENRPYIVKNDSSGDVVMVVDTTGKYTTLEQAKAPILITETKVLTKGSGNQQRVNEFSTAMNITIKPDKVNSFIKKFVPFLWIPIFFVALLISYIYRIVQALVYGIIGMLFASVAGVRLSYWQIVQIMMVAITPVIVVCTILKSLDVAVTHHNLFYFSLAMIYMFYGINANKPLKAS